MPDAGNNASRLRFRPFLRSDALAMMSWRYPPPYSAYNLDSPEPTVLAELLRTENRYHAILCDGEMIGFFSVGPDARVPGWNYDDNALDVGMGLRPDRTGQGQGYVCLTAILAFVGHESPGRVLRATVLAWNQRALRVCHRAGFRPVATFKKKDAGDHDCIVLLRNPSRSSLL